MKFALPGWQLALLRHGRWLGGALVVAVVAGAASASLVRGAPAFEWIPGIFAAAVAVIALRTWSRSRRERIVREAPLPPYLRRKLLEAYPGLGRKDAELVERGLRQFFLACLRSRGAFVAMPSRVVDAMWHDFILHTHAYRAWCEVAIGRFLHHTPAEVLGSNAGHNDGLRRAWFWACKEEAIAPRKPSRLPLLFALDAKLAIPDGFRYVPDCGAPRRTDEGGGGGAVYCGESFGDGSAAGDGDGFGGADASSGGMDGGADGGGGDGGGCGGGGD